MVAMAVYGNLGSFAETNCQITILMLQMETLNDLNLDQILQKILKLMVNMKWLKCWDSSTIKILNQRLESLWNTIKWLWNRVFTILGKRLWNIK